MPLPFDRSDDRHPGPWSFHAYRWGFPNVIVDGAGGYIVSSVPASCGPLLAAGPSLLVALERIAAAASPRSAVHELATGALETFREREGITLADWRAHAPAPRLRIAGVAT